MGVSVLPFRKPIGSQIKDVPCPDPVWSSIVVVLMMVWLLRWWLNLISIQYFTWLPSKTCIHDVSFCGWIMFCWPNLPSWMLGSSLSGLQTCPRHFAHCSESWLRPKQNAPNQARPYWAPNDSTWNPWSKRSPEGIHREFSNTIYQDIPKYPLVNQYFLPWKITMRFEWENSEATPRRAGSSPTGKQVKMPCPLRLSDVGYSIWLLFFV